MNPPLDQSDNAILAAIHWVEMALLGSVSTVIATIAVASLGYLAFTGRIDFRRAAQVIFGCFVLFGAPTIAAGLQNLASLVGSDPPPAEESNLAKPLIGLTAPRPAAPVKRPGYDPYAGAAIAPE